MLILNYWNFSVSKHANMLKAYVTILTLLRVSWICWIIGQMKEIEIKTKIKIIEVYFG